MEVKHDIKVLIGCEESQAVCIEFRKLGIEAYSCDIQECSGGHPEWHFNQDIFEVIKMKDWDCMIAFPPCTHLAVAGARHFEQKIKDGRQKEGIDFFMSMVNAPIKHIAIENPIGIMSTKYKKPTQVIHPYYFGDDQSKATCLWLKNLPCLYHNKTVNLFDDVVTHNTNVQWHKWVDKKTGKERRYSKFLADAWLKNTDKKTVSLLRSKTFPGIAKAMAIQWGEYLLNQQNNY